MTELSEDKLHKIKKLLDLSRNAGSEAEAALAAARAAELMTRHNLTEAELRLLDPTNTAEPIEKAFALDGSVPKRMAAWKATVAYAVAHLYGCHQYYCGGQLRLLGRKSACEAVQYTYHYLVREVDELCEKIYESTGLKLGRGDAKRWRNNFRLGASNGLSRRLHVKKAQTEQERKDALRKVREEVLRNSVAGEGAVVENQAAADLVATLTQANLPASTVALAVVQADQDEVDHEYTTFSRGFGRHRSTARVTSRSAYVEGQKAAEKIRLGSARGDLPKAPDQIRGAR